MGFRQAIRCWERPTGTALESPAFQLELARSLIQLAWLSPATEALQGHLRAQGILRRLTASHPTDINYQGLLGSTYTNLANIQAGNYIRFNAVVNNVKGLPSSGQVKL